MKLRGGSLKEEIQLANLQQELSRKKRIKINKIRNERGQITVNITEIQRIMNTMKKQELRKMRRGLGTLGTTLNIPAPNHRGARRKERVRN